MTSWASKIYKKGCFEFFEIILYKDSDMEGSSSVKNGVETDDNDVVDVGLRRSKRIKERVCKRRAVVRKKKPSKTDKVAHVLAHILIPVTAFQGLV